MDQDQLQKDVEFFKSYNKIVTKTTKLLRAEDSQLSEIDAIEEAHNKLDDRFSFNMPSSSRRLRTAERMLATKDYVSRNKKKVARIGVGGATAIALTVAGLTIVPPFLKARHLESVTEGEAEIERLVEQSYVNRQNLQAEIDQLSIQNQNSPSIVSILDSLLTQLVSGSDEFFTNNAPDGIADYAVTTENWGIVEKELAIVNGVITTVTEKVYATETASQAIFELEQIYKNITENAVDTHIVEKAERAYQATQVYIENANLTRIQGTLNELREDETKLLLEYDSKIVGAFPIQIDGKQYYAVECIAVSPSGETLTVSKYDIFEKENNDVASWLELITQEYYQRKVDDHNSGDGLTDDTHATKTRWEYDEVLEPGVGRVFGTLTWWDE